MKFYIHFILLLTFVFLSYFNNKSGEEGKGKEMPTKSKIYTFIMKTIDGKNKSLSDYEGKVLLIVNVASKCGHTPQYKGLEEIYRKYKDKGFVILGFPANNFLSQEPGTDEKIKKFCSLNYDVTFDMFSKISVKGKDKNPLYKYLTEESSVRGEVKWNFQKYLINRRGEPVAKYSPTTKPTDPELIEKLEQLLNEK